MSARVLSAVEAGHVRLLGAGDHRTGLQNRIQPSVSTQICLVTCSQTKDKTKLLADVILHLLDIETIEPVPTHQRFKDVYSVLFIVPKKSGDWRAILNLRDLNTLVKKHKFCMESLRSILQALQQGDLLQSLDLKEAYLHAPIHLMSRQYLRFAFKDSTLNTRLSPLAFCYPMGIYQSYCNLGGSTEVRGGACLPLPG